MSEGPTSDPGPPGPRGRWQQGRIGGLRFTTAVLLALLAVCVVLAVAVVIKTSADARAAAHEVAGYSPAPVAATSSTPAGRVVALIGDGSVTVASPSVAPGGRWPSLVSADIGGRVVVAGSAGAGYTAAGSSGDTFVASAGDVPTDAEIVVFVGSAADAGSSALNVAKAATQAFSIVARRAPAAKIVVVPPFVTDGAAASRLSALRSVLRSSARLGGASFVESTGWLRGGAPRSASVLTQADEQAVAARITALIRARAA